MGIKIEVGEGGKAKQIMDPNTVILMGHDCELFPLFTKSDMAARWGVQLKLVGMWSVRHDDFPKPVKGILAHDTEQSKRGGGRLGGLYPFYEVKRYEAARGLVSDRGTREALRLLSELQNAGELEDGK